MTLENELGIPVRDARVGMSVVLGPSRGSALTCVGTPAPATVPGSTCSSDIDGRVALTYRVARNPNRHRQEQYILDAASSGAMLSEAGLPTNPMRAAGTGHGARGNAGSLPRSAEAGESAGAGDFGVASRRSSSSRQATDESPEDTPEASAGFLDAQRVVSSGSACGAAFLMPGEQVQLVAAGFAPGAAVSFLVRAASLDGTELEGLSVPAATAGDDGLLKVAWSVPSAPSSDEDPVPRGYVVDASGPGAGGGTHSAYMVEPVVAYSGTSPCAVPDTAAARRERPVSRERTATT